MRRILLNSIIFLLLLSILGCDSKDKLNRIPDINELCQTIIENVQYDDELVMPSQRAIEDMYDIEFNDVEEFAVFVSGTMATSNELFVMKLADASLSTKTIEALNGRIEDQMNNYRDYNPSELFRLENAMIIQEGTYFLLSVSNDNETVKKLFYDAFE